MIHFLQDSLHETNLQITIRIFDKKINVESGYAHFLVWWIDLVIFIGLYEIQNANTELVLLVKYFGDNPADYRNIGMDPALHNRELSGKKDFEDFFQTFHTYTKLE